MPTVTVTIYTKIDITGPTSYYPDVIVAFTDTC